MNKKTEKFSEVTDFFICPKCSSSFSMINSSYVCSNKHSFDIARKGYINYLQNRKNYDGYTKESFENREEIFNLGLYDHILRKLTEIIRKLSPETILDIGTGDGYYVNNMDKDNQISSKIFAMDFSKEAINIASSGINNIFYFVADIASIPLKDNSMDLIMNIYTKANYREFKRILKKDGYIIKIIPGNSHMKELRNLISFSLKNKDYSNLDTKNIFLENFSMVKNYRETEVFDIDEEVARTIIEMSPIMFQKDKNTVNVKELTSITIDAEILVGKKI